jgi:Ni,Fe-hydrogenase III small subunit
VIGSWASVVVDAHLIGGFAGAAAASVELTQNYWDVEASGISEAMAGGDADVSDVTGLQTDQMQGQAAYSNMPGLDFEQVWHLTQDYPALQWEDVDALPIPAEPGPARVQIIHNSADPAAAAVDIYVNGGLLVDSLAFRAATPFVDVPFDTPLLIEIYPYGADPAQSDAAYSLEDALFAADESYTIIASGLLGEGFAANPDELDTDFDLYVIEGTKESHDEMGEASFFVWHGTTDAPGVDVFARETAQLADDLKYTDYTGYVEVPAADYIIDVASADSEEVLVSFAAPLSELGGQSLVVLASGFLNTEANNEGAAFGLLVVQADGTALLLTEHEDTELFAGGSGTETDPWQVATAEHLNEVRNHRADYFLQIADIDLSDAGEFIPIAASRESNFLGTYDGGGHVVSNLTVRLGGSNNGQALFGFLGDTGVIRNLGVVNADVIGGSNTAALVGRNEGGLVRNCWSTGTVRSEAGAHVNTGGLVGFMLNGALVENSHSIVDVSTTGRRAGGLVGTNDGATISNSYATGTVISEREADNAWSGGLVGEAIGDAQVIGSWASVVVDAHLIGGFVGASSADVVLAQNYWDVEASGISEAMAGGDADVSDVTGLQTDQMQGQAAYSNMPGLDFEQVWHLTQGYPALRWEDVDPLPLPTVVELYSPEDRESGVELTPTLRWYALDGVTSYQVQLANDAEFTDLLFDVTTSDTLLVLDSSLILRPFTIGG